MKHEIYPTVDYAFELLFGSEADTSLLIDLLNAVSLNNPHIIGPQPPRKREGWTATS